MMDTIIILLHVMKPWLSFGVFIYLCVKMTGWAKNRKAGAIAFGMFFQMILPDPCAQSTIEAVAERKQEVKKQQDENGEPLEPSKDSDVGDKKHHQ